MKISNILVTHSHFPDKLLNSIDRSNIPVDWLVFFHGHDLRLKDRIAEAVAVRSGRFFPYCLNRGLSKSWNEGAMIALENKSDLIFLLNDDMFFYDDKFNDFVDFVSEQKIARPRLAGATVSGLETGGHYAGKTQQQGFACCCLVPKAFEEVGYFDENFKPAYFEDIDYARRMWLAGVEFLHDSRTLVEHERSLTTRLDLDLKKANDESFQKCRRYYAAKWGGEQGAETFARPFGSPLYDHKILAENHAVPYDLVEVLSPGSGFSTPADTVAAEPHHSLPELALKYGSDKWGSHFYASHYQRHFERFKHENINVLEIGIGGYGDPKAGGASLRMWRDFFPKATIYGLDIEDKSPHDDNRIITVKGSQIDRERLLDLHARSRGFDIIIDDGSNVCAHVIESFKILFPLLKVGGIYAIEDLQTSYWHSFGGNAWPEDDKDTSMGFFKSLVDGLNHVEFDAPGYEPSIFDKYITSIHFYHNLCFIYKGLNNEPSNMVAGNVLPDIIGGSKNRLGAIATERPGHGLA